MSHIVVTSWGSNYKRALFGIFQSLILVNFLGPISDCSFNIFFPISSVKLYKHLFAQASRVFREGRVIYLVA
jgi:hypothetical protein